MGMFSALSVFGRRIKGMIWLRSEQVGTCNVTRHHHLLLSPLGSRNKLGTPWCNTHRILLCNEARDEVQIVTPYCVSHLQCYGMW
jgi:hypothetical protein